MNIDERLEALTHSVELLASMHKGGERTMAELAREMKRVGKGVERLGNRHGRLEELVSQIAEGTARLLRVVEVHESHIRNLEQRNF